ncbi:MMPL family transporter [Nocardiopsis dassonvillei]|uniref:MMPL domain protein n=1 Tax=Nocardiopsis dassonvillei (strain ATCC 23218 / DSM 43111 / CIP 107115 / JCM 7437 / KCTC 9190 / NBRC 14626 / NCTC 10488 / NRRL B-5397 / IMRU 509) TaxID=446468 RepID=D7AZY4_NOCDD|nr:MMPL family transporter [Nocardiopsis dassonvillei]ADH68255.1 MMPL domain protein [Nocardiopsis dassonvillei subsp. dassonvillei DSM 43111]NKY78345.1 MMPL family transporter [Nocardiopsis dassonvillei]VEI88759.1 Putative membrane protein ydgH [Nocardiopsis dassonvillei]
MPTQTGLFGRLGRGVHRWRWAVLAATAVFAVFSGIWGSGLFSDVSESGFEDPDSESARATRVLEEELGHDGVDVVAVYRSDEIRVDNPTFAAAVQRIADGMPEDAVADFDTYLDEDLGETERGMLVAEDMDATYIPVTLSGETHADRLHQYEEVAEYLSSSNLEVHLGGSVAIEHELAESAESDVVRAELITLPILLFLLVLIFGGLVAGLVPLAVGGLAILGSLTLLRALTHVTEVSVFAINVATILGLGLAIDYGLFMVSRFREELRRGRSIADAVSRTVDTAGRTVAFSGITVGIAFAGLLFFPQPILKSIGWGGIAVVVFDLLAALVFLPALMAAVGHRVNRLRLPLPRRTVTGAVHEGAWSRLARVVMRGPAVSLVAVGGVLLVFSAGLASTELGSTDQRYLPADSGSRIATEALSDDFPAGGLGTLDVAVVGGADDGALEEYTERLAGLEEAVSATVERTGEDVAHVVVAYRGASDSPEVADLVRDVRAEPVPEGAEESLVGGVAAMQQDNVAAIVDAAPMTVGFVATATLLLLFLAFGSIVLPVKAVLMGALSLGASLGVVVWGFQEGAFSGLLGFEAVGTIDPTYLVLIIVVAFGLAMDYELFLLSRVREEYLRTGDNTRSVAAGLQHTGQIITSAAILLMVVLLAMGTSDLLFLKVIGIGLAIAVLVDATLVRAVMVPATMRLLGGANWWLPRPLRWLHDRIGISEGGDEDGPEPAVERDGRRRVHAGV